MTREHSISKRKETMSRTCRWRCRQHHHTAPSLDHLQPFPFPFLMAQLYDDSHLAPSTQDWVASMQSMQLSLPPRLHRQHRLQDVFHDPGDAGSSSSLLDLANLTERAQWIRDKLDPQMADRGPNVLSSDEVVILYQLLEALRRSPPPASIIRRSRIHFAILLISARATRWPSRIITEADVIIEEWTKRYGPLSQLRPPLYEEGGRLYNISTPLDLNKEVLNIKWTRQFGIDSRHAYQVGNLGFKPGQ